eukprot:scaffold426324_cov18-Prasinocladus_malaysianus.AAC.1
MARLGRPAGADLRGPSLGLRVGFVNRGPRGYPLVAPGRRCPDAFSRTSGMDVAEWQRICY